MTRRWVLVLGFLIAWGALTGAIGGWLVKRQADQQKLDLSRAEMRTYIQAASYYSTRMVQAEGMVSYMRQLPECTAQ